jgi:hypothetical protein
MNRKLKLLVASLIAGVGIAGAAYAASSPTVATGPTSNITTSSALLHGTINPNGAPTTYQFEWGLTKQYGVTSAAKTVRGIKKVSVKATAGHLLPGTVYHYRLVATNKSGSTAGSDHKFRTAGNPPPAAATGGPANIGTNSATVSGVINPHGAKTTWVFQWGTTPYQYQTFGGTVPAGNAPVIVAQTLTGLQAGAVFHYRIVAYHGSAVVAAGSDLTFITRPVPRPSPRIKVRTKPGRDAKKPFTFTTSGTVIGSARFPATVNCLGDVTVRFSLGKRTVASSVIPLKPDCTFSTRTTFRRMPGHGRRPSQERLRIRVSFGGNGYLAPGRARNESVRLG